MCILICKQTHPTSITTCLWYYKSNWRVHAKNKEQDNWQNIL